MSRPSLVFPLPPWGDPRLGTCPFANTSRGRGRDGIIAVLFNQNWKRDHDLLSSLPRRGRDTVIALLYWPPPLSVITSSSLPLRVWINSGQSCRYAALKCHRKAISPTTDLSIQKRAVLMYSDEKLLFYDLFIKSLIENYFLWGFCVLWCFSLSK